MNWALDKRAGLQIGLCKAKLMESLRSSAQVWLGFRRRVSRRIISLILVGLLTACRTVEPVQSMDFSAPGWKVQHGQAVWRPVGAQDIAGELMVATRADGCAFVQFSKPPITLVTTQRTAEHWVAHFPPNRQVNGTGPAPERIIWLHLTEFLGRAKAGPPWKWEQHNAQTWRLENGRTGESLEGYLAP